MIIKNKTAKVYDVEIFPNCFHVTVRDTEDNSLHLFEISERKNQLEKLCTYFQTNDAIFVGYNNHHYDDLIINYILEYQSVMGNLPYYDVCKSLFNMSQLIVKSGDEPDISLKHYKYAKLFESMDLLTMLFSSKLRKGLKEMQMTMHYKCVDEYEGDFESPIVSKDIDRMIQYNINDVDSTTELLNRCKKDIELRIWIEQEYGINAYSMDGVKIGERISLSFHLGILDFSI